ncbi:hypothetical protein J4Q44_G00016660 [Coregonus suidteri]|uniref:Uncharacterized protein n=1 Tax=Coregonus suidteri TaxID=861788 RepID=A0AAN8MFK7_9TELE
MQSRSDAAKFNISLRLKLDRSWFRRRTTITAMLPGIPSRQYRDKATPGARPQNEAIEVELEVEEALMDRAVVVLLTVCCLLQWPLATTGRQPGTKPHIFYAVEMDGGTRAAQALAEQHGLQFISRAEMMYGCKGHMLVV